MLKRYSNSILYTFQRAYLGGKIIIAKGKIIIGSNIDVLREIVPISDDYNL
jgi:hypothetical protein